MRFASLIEELRSVREPTLHVRPDPGPVPRLALLSGSFDPPTVAHVALAEAARRRAGRVAMVYAVDTLAKEGPPVPPLLEPEERLEALSRLCEGRGYLMALASHGLLSEQVRAAADLFPDAELFVAAGSDKVLQVLDPKWYEDVESALAELFERARLLYAERAGEEGLVERALARPASAAWRGRVERLDVPPEVAAVSSRLVRSRLRAGKPALDLVPEEVRDIVRRAASARAQPE